MIRKLRLKFICLTMGALIVMLSIVVVGMNAINYNSVTKEADAILQFISQHNGVFPAQITFSMQKYKSPMTAETPYESRYFSVLVCSDGEIVGTDISRIMSVDNANAVEYANRALKKNANVGFIDEFRFLKSSEGEFTRITFLHCERRLAAFRNFLYASISTSLLGLVIVFLGIVLISGKIIKPVAESYEKQKRFITDAGHEIKTPLTIINANVDLLEADPEDEECINDIRVQTKRLASLTNDLVFLTKMEEPEKAIKKESVSLSEVVSEVASSFQALAITTNKEIVCNIQKSVAVNGNYKNLVQLTNLLIDNAIKYSPENSQIKVTLKKTRNITLTIQNDTVNKINKKELNLLFERFYRADGSRNSETGGHGIGLSVAKAIVTSHGGKISAVAEGENKFAINVVL